MKRSIFVGLLVVLVALPALAQQQYGSLAGTVVDNQQQALPGATVNLSGPFMQGVRMAITDAEGHFRFVPVPPGTGYALTFELQGFNTIEKTGIVVNLGRETQLNAEMSPSKFAETITVIAEKIVVDTSKTTVDTNVDWKLVDSLPTNRNFQSMMQMAPGVKSGNNPYVHGASNDANIYLIDGVDTTDPRTQTWGTAINWDTIQEAQVQTAGFQAEYGRAVGGVVNLVTKSGGNQFSFTARAIWQKIDWSAKGGIDSETGMKKPGAGTSDETRPNATLGGPIVKDALWFYTAYERRANHRVFSYYPTLADLQSNQNQTSGKTDYLGRYVSGKLTYQVSPNHSIVGYYDQDPIDLEPLNRGWNETSTTHYSPDAELHQFQGGNNSSLQWYGILSPNLFIEAKYQHHKQELNVTPQGGPFNDVPYERISTPNGYYYYGAPYYDYRSLRNRDGGSVAASYFLDTPGGSHQFKAGLEYLKLSPETGRLYNALGYYRNSASGGPSSRYTWTDQVASNTTDQTYAALFIQDQWKFGRATINLGLRADSTSIDNNVGHQILNFGLDKAIAPRLGFAYDLNGDSLHASLGRFYSLASNYFADYFNAVPTNQQYWSWNRSCALDPSKNNWQYPDTCWNQIYDVNLGASAVLSQHLRPAYTDEFTLGYDRLLSPQFAAGINFVYRNMPYALDAYDPDETGVSYLTPFPNNLGNNLGNNFMKYQAVELNLKKRFGPDGFQFLLAYTYVFTYDSWTTEYRNTFPDVVLNQDSNNKLWYGRMESPSEIKLNGSYTMPWNTIVGVSAYWNTGNLFTPYHTNPDTGYSDPDGRRGSGRVGNNYNIDLHVEQPVKLGPVTVAGYIDLFNVTNVQDPTARNANTASATYLQPTAWQAPRRFQAGFRIEY